jgi:hypothetical protein
MHVRARAYDLRDVCKCMLVDDEFSLNVSGTHVCVHDKPSRLDSGDIVAAACEAVEKYEDRITVVVSKRIN